MNYYRKEKTDCIRLLVADNQEDAFKLTKEKQHGKIENLKNCSIFFPLDEIIDTEHEYVEIKF